MKWDGASFVVLAVTFSFQTFSILNESGSKSAIE